MALSGLMTFDLWGHHTCRWYGFWYSIRVRSLRFVGLPVPKIWLISISAWWHCLNGVTGYPCDWFPSWQFSACCALTFST